MRSKPPAKSAKDNPAFAFAAPPRRFRLLPVVMAAAAVLLGIKVNGMAVSAYAMLSDEPAAEASAAQAADMAAISPSAANPKAETADPEAARTEAVAAPTAEPEVLPEAMGESDFLSRSEINLLQDLSERRRKLEERAGELDTRERLLMAAEQRIDHKIERLKSLEGSIKDLVRVHNEKEEAQLQALVKIYETMKPKDAAAILEKLDMPVLLSVVERMKAQKVAGVLAAMDTKVAREVTTELASRQALPPEQQGES